MTFKIVWSTPAGRFGWVTITECVDMDDALNHWHTFILGADAPSDATIDKITRI